ncbi:MAG: metal-dependent hydrolase [Deltaproteobacteria bacterium]|nr:metal-dependent hydrolase [Deltaproteobacteria bacterium]
MASLFGHAAVAATVAKLAPLRLKPSRFWGLMCLAAVLPDFDAVGFLFGIPYSSQWGHRGFTHSFVFAAVVALAFARFAVRGPTFASARGAAVAFWLFVSCALHPVLDALTNGGLGVAFLWPFNSERFFLPYRPIEVSPIGVTQFFSLRGLEVIQSELIYVFVPCALALAAGWGMRWLRGTRR